MRQRLTGSRPSKPRYSTNFHARFVRREKSLVKNFCDKKERSFDFLPFEGKRIDFGANKPKLRRFEIRAFCDKMRPFCTISGSTFWKIHPDVCMYVCVCLCLYIHFNEFSISFHGIKTPIKQATRFCTEAVFYVCIRIRKVLFLTQFCK